ncbi:hypothetical protein I79_005793 [Cricetulus griseus]|uniref:Uncharacterized protein n=1 Tax=Cricetulus griseus TaxID=10029 RepID=G3H642_CRIGR|nr:hypothetical protein I79_005793 [Cricetulus griseus]
MRSPQTSLVQENWSAKKISHHDLQKRTKDKTQQSLNTVGSPGVLLLGPDSAILRAG